MREALLPFTLRNAARLGMYRELWDGCAVEKVKSTADLRLLPTLTKEKYRAALMHDADATSATEHITHSTGTTGALTWRHRTREEVAIITRLFSASPVVRRDEPLPLALTFRTSRHGMAIPMPSRSRMMPIAITDDEEVVQCLQVLVSDFRFRNGTVRPTAVVGGSFDVALLAQAVLEHGIAPDQLSIRQLAVGGFVDTALRRLLTTAFPDAALVEKYSLSEVFGGAVRYPGSNVFILDSYVVGEVVDDAGGPVAVGDVGELTLTELFPFVQAQPLVRYRTGDVVRRVADSGGQLAFEWWGRRSRCLHAADGVTWSLAYSVVADELSLHDLVARQKYRSDLTLISGTDVGPPCFRYDVDDKGVVDIEVGLRVSPWWATESVRALIAELWSLLRETALPRDPAMRIRLRFSHLTGAPAIWNGGATRGGLSLQAASLAGPPPSIAVQGATAQ